MNKKWIIFDCASGDTVCTVECNESVLSMMMQGEFFEECDSQEVQVEEIPKPIHPEQVTLGGVEFIPVDVPKNNCSWDEDDDDIGRIWECDLYHQDKIECPEGDAVCNGRIFKRV